MNDNFKEFESQKSKLVKNIKLRHDKLINFINSCVDLDKSLAKNSVYTKIWSLDDKLLEAIQKLDNLSPIKKQS